MLTATLTVLNISYPPVVYVNSPSHSFTGGNLMLKTVRGAVKIYYCWTPYV
jgi:hypothetical protein